MIATISSAKSLTQWPLAHTSPTSLRGTLCNFIVGYKIKSTRKTDASSCQQQILGLVFAKLSSRSTQCHKGDNGEILRTTSIDSREFERKVDSAQHKFRLDAFLSEKMPRASRAKIQSSIREGFVTINGVPQTKPAFRVKHGDMIHCTLPPPPPSEASPEDIPIDIVFEDAHLLVVNKPPHMVVHPAPGHFTGTLVHALLHHCQLPAMQVWTGNQKQPVEDGNGDEEEDEEVEGPKFEPIPGMWGPPPVIRPGIVHRLDKGTSGLLVVAKDEFSHAHLCDQFKARTVQRSYISILCGTPADLEGRIEAPIGRDPRDRQRMAVVTSGARNSTSKYAASRFKVLEVLAGGGASLVEWKLETGRTHQIRVHAKHMGHPILGDDSYGGGGKAAFGFLSRNLPLSKRPSLQQVVSLLTRPCLHARTIGFTHPETGTTFCFCSDPATDFLEVVQLIRNLMI